MKRILVCFKITYELDKMTPKEVKNYCEGDENLSFIKRIFGSYDEAALETTLRMADEGNEMGLEVESSAVTVGHCDERFAKELFAAGYFDVTSISGGESIEYDPEKVAGYICQFIIEKGPFDAIVTGQQAGLGENAQIPYIIAESLGYPCIANVKDMHFLGEKIRVRSKTDTGYCSKTVSCPAVYAVGNALHPYLRISTLRKKLSVQTRKISEFVPAEFIPKMGIMHRQCLIFENHEKNCVFIEGDTIEEKIDYLLNNIIKDDI